MLDIMKNIVEFLEINSKKYADKVAYTDSENKITYSALNENAKRIATGIVEQKLFRKPIVLFIDKNIKLISALYGSLYSANFYVIIDTLMPVDRIKAIFDTLKPSLIVFEQKYNEKVEELGVEQKIAVEELLNYGINQEKIDNAMSEMIDTDLAYGLYTSGSTGVPKGAVINHNTLLQYIDWYKTEFDINDQTVFGGQTPLYFSASVSDFFASMVAGATYHIIDKRLFTFPIKVIEFLNEKKVNTIYWVPSALCIFANLKVLDYMVPKYLKKVMFIGEVMPTKQLNYWRKFLPEVEYTNLYGPTETVDVCTFFKINREFKDDEPLPIGKHCNNCDVFILKDDNTLAKVGEEGELCVRGSFLASEYYNNPEKTASAFPQNPLNSAYPERMYRTGDLVKELENGDIMYITRKDFQIKHMGYRIELGEIEMAFSSMEGMRNVVSIYDKDEDKIVLIYEGKITEEEIYKRAQEKLPKYMWPNVTKRVRQMTLNANGKIDRVYYKNNYKEL